MTYNELRELEIQIRLLLYKLEHNVGDAIEYGVIGKIGGIYSEYRICLDTIEDSIKYKLIRLSCGYEIDIEYFETRDTCVSKLLTLIINKEELLKIISLSWFIIYRNTDVKIDYSLIYYFDKLFITDH